VQPWIELAQAHLRAKQANEAAAAASRALERNPGHPWALAVSGEALLAQGRRTEGLQSLERALAAQPRRPEVWLTLARAFDAAGVPAKAAWCRRQGEAIKNGA
jgi:predicted Zn-dependent protease